MADAAKELKDLQDIINDQDAQIKKLTKTAKKVKGLQATIASYENQSATLQRSMVLLDSLVRATATNDEWAYTQAAGAGREFLDKMEFKTPA